MTFFGAQLGKRPADERPDEQPAPTAAPREQRASPFAASLGARPADATTDDQRHVEQETRRQGDKETTTSPLTRSPAHPLTECPLCRGALEQRGGVFHCAGRCGARWLEESPGKLVDLAALPFGICACCAPPLALIRGAAGAVCPASGSAYLLLPDGPKLRAEAAPHGLCLCCAPPAPLVYAAGALVCQAQPANVYQRDGDRLALVEQRRSADATLDAIDAALRRNAARLTVHGLFDLD